MVKHIILWELKDELENKKDIMSNIKNQLESLHGKIDGLIEIKVNISNIDSSNVDIMLDTTFKDRDSLKNYSKNPEHVHVASTYVRPYYKERHCIDYEI